MPREFKLSTILSHITEMQQTKIAAIKDFVIIIIAAWVIMLPIRMLLVDPFVVSGGSMDNTFHNGNYLIIDEISYRFEKPQRGDVIVFQAPQTALAVEGQSLPTKNFWYYVREFTFWPEDTYYIKRVIGLPGETVQIDGDQVKIYNAANPNGFTLNEPYAYMNPSLPTSTIAFFEGIHKKITLGPDEYFVMGDDRHNSSDSRIWGVLPGENITGRVLLRLAPLSQVSVFPGKYASY